MYVKILSGQKLINKKCEFYCTLFYNNVHYTKKQLGNYIYTTVLMQTMKTGQETVIIMRDSTLFAQRAINVNKINKIISSLLLSVYDAKDCRPRKYSKGWEKLGEPVK